MVAVATLAFISLFFIEGDKLIFYSVNICYPECVPNQNIVFIFYIFII